MFFYLLMEIDRKFYIIIDIVFSISRCKSIVTTFCCSWMFLSLIVTIQHTLSFTGYRTFKRQLLNRTINHRACKTNVSTTRHTISFLLQRYRIIIEINRALYIGTILIVNRLCRVLDTSITISRTNIVTIWRFALISHNCNIRS